MPKGAIHHLHSSAAPNLDSYIKLTYYDCVYFNERDRLFKVATNGLDEDGYIRCVDMRKYSKCPQAYDQKLRDYIRMTPAECASKEEHAIWAHFQHKFTLTSDLVKYDRFFRIILRDILEACYKQNVFIVELRYIAGLLMGEERRPIGLKEELELIEDVFATMKREL